MAKTKSNAPEAAVLRAWGWARQGLDGSLKGATAAQVLERSGWARSVGGVGPYLTFFSRAQLSRSAVDAALKDVEIHELPAARGCTYVVPKQDFALALTVGQSAAQAALKPGLKLGVTMKELDKLNAAVLKAVEAEPLEVEQIREAVGSAARSLGAEGTKKGVSTTLPLALGQLQAQGQIRRVPTNGRLDQQRYRYVRWKNAPKLLDAQEAFTELARRYFSWVGPAMLKQFAGFSALGVKAAQQAVEPLKLVPIAEGDERLVLPKDLDALRAFKPPKGPAYALVGSLDSIAAHRRDIQPLLEAKDAKTKVLGDAAMATPLFTFADLPSHAILERGRLVGLWEFDADAQGVAWATFSSKPDAALKAAVAATESYVRGDLGDARSFSLDSPKSRAPRIAVLRSLAA
jgi:hypothetical protein